MTKSAGVLLYNIVNRGNHGRAEPPGTSAAIRATRFLYKLGPRVAVERLAGRPADLRRYAGQEGIDVPEREERDGSP